LAQNPWNFPFPGKKYLQPGDHTFPWVKKPSWEKPRVGKPFFVPEKVPR